MDFFIFSLLKTVGFPGFSAGVIGIIDQVFDDDQQG